MRIINELAPHYNLIDYYKSLKCYLDLYDSDYLHDNFKINRFGLNHLEQAVKTARPILVLKWHNGAMVTATRVLCNQFPNLLRISSLPTRTRSTTLISTIQKSLIWGISHPRKWKILRIGFPYWRILAVIGGLLKSEMARDYWKPGKSWMSICITNHPPKWIPIERHIGHPLNIDANDFHMDLG